MFLIIAVLLFGIYIANVVMGAMPNMSPFVGDVQEMLILFAASIAFVIAVLRREAAEKNNENREP
ncbi:MAG: hypothetical protein QNJ35_09335 [Paracoccaceae bacterium]|nr:hypothetical protein [Paracoccaceae bacterium]